MARSRLQAAVDQVARAARRLAADQKIRARRTARTGLRKAVAGLLAIVDDDYPVIRRKTSYRRLAAATDREKIGRLRERGFVPCANTDLVTACAMAGVRALSGPNPNLATQAKRSPMEVGIRSRLVWVPAWAAEIGNDVHKLMKARKSFGARKALLAEKRMQTHTEARP